MTSNSQEDTGNWIMYFGTNKISDRLSIHSEVQYRNHTISPTNIEQLLLRFKVSSELIFDQMYRTYFYAHIGNLLMKNSWQNGICLRLSWNKANCVLGHTSLTANKIGALKFEHRYELKNVLLIKLKTCCRSSN